ncbi:hypothetical protein ACETK8_12190 [Brevundimonas staleyi]|uniref:Sugar transporter n=1 Tax=Brevundimonas staleyi TaxID=74326 RepID=A0ABW0FR27_9CAUL
MADGTKTPWHLWLVGGLSLLWNGFGAYDFIMTNTQGEAYMRASGMTQPMIDYFLAMPDWMYAPWIAGVWGAVAGSVLLLLRMKWAVYAFAISLIGALGSLVFGLMNPMPGLPPEMAAMKFMPWIIAVIAAALLFYARAMAKKGALR